MTDKQEIVAAQTEQLPVQSEQATLMNLIAKMASDPQADVPKLERLIELRNAEMARQAKAAYDADFVIMKPFLPLVIRTHDNSQTKSKYAKIEDVNQAVDPILSRYGFATTSKVLSQTADSVTMRLEVRHREGHAESMELTMPIDDKGAQGTVNKTKIHAISSTITYIKRVGFCALLNISTGDDKDGNHETSFISMEQAAELDARLRAISDKALPNFLKWAKVEKLLDIPAKFYNASIKAAVDMEAKKVKA
jgi:hypothetical protein